MHQGGAKRLSLELLRSQTPAGASPILNVGLVSFSMFFGILSEVSEALQASDLRLNIGSYLFAFRKHSAINACFRGPRPLLKNWFVSASSVGYLKQFSKVSKMLTVLGTSTSGFGYRGRHPPLGNYLKQIWSPWPALGRALQA